MATCMAIGQAAGTAAALSSRLDKSPQQLDTAELRQVLADNGAILD
jgi:hypothetical protein